MSESAPSRPLPDRIIAWALQRKPVRAWFLYLEHQGPVLSGSVTYSTLFSVFAGVLLSFSVAGLWLSNNPDARQALVDGINAVIPGLFSSGGDEGAIDPTATVQVPVGFTVTGILSLLFLVIAATGAIGALRASLRLMADEVHDDAFWVWVLVRNFGLAVLIGALLAAAAGATFLANAGIELVGGWFGIGSEGVLFTVLARVVTIIVVFALDTVVIAILFSTLSGVKASARALWPGSLYGGVGLIVLQQLSSLFVGGARNNPLLASFAALVVLLVWFNFSAQVILVACAYILTSVDEEHDRVSARFGASTFEQRRVQQAERKLRIATTELDQARADEAKQRDAWAERVAEADSNSAAAAEQGRQKADDTST